MKFLQIPTCSTNHLTFDSNSFLTSFHPLNECPVHIYVLQCVLRHDSSIHLGIIRLDSLALFSTISAGCRRQIGVPSATTIDAKSTSNNVKQVDEPFNLFGFTRPYYSHANEAWHVRHTLGADRTRKMSGRWCDSHHKFHTFCFLNRKCFRRFLPPSPQPHPIRKERTHKQRGEKIFIPIHSKLSNKLWTFVEIARDGTQQCDAAEWNCCPPRKE